MFLKWKIKTSTICESFALRKLGSIPVPPQSPACTTKPKQVLARVIRYRTKTNTFKTKQVIQWKRTSQTHEHQKRNWQCKCHHNDTKHSSQRSRSLLLVIVINYCICSLLNTENIHHLFQLQLSFFWYLAVKCSLLILCITCISHFLGFLCLSLPTIMFTLLSIVI